MMPSSDENQKPDRSRLAAFLAITAGVLAALMAWLYYTYPAAEGLSQPLPFSHRLHAGDKQISCFFCHPGAMGGSQAGIPPLQTCMLCHQKIITTYPKIVELREHYAARAPIEWERVNQMQEFVYFSHEAHIRKGFDCSVCHGNVKGMDRIAPPQEFTMGFCVQCHRDNQGSTACLTCHR